MSHVSYKRELKLSWWFCYIYSQVKFAWMCGMSCGDQRINIQSRFESSSLQGWDIISKVNWLFFNIVPMGCDI